LGPNPPKKANDIARKGSKFYEVQNWPLLRCFTTARLIACFQLHPKRNRNDDKINGVQNRHTERAHTKKPTRMHIHSPRYGLSAVSVCQLTLYLSRGSAEWQNNGRQIVIRRAQSHRAA
jgi:hypothetical protein